MFLRTVAAAGAVILGGATAQAAVVEASNAGLNVEYSFSIATTPTQVYAALIRPAAWWSSEHTFSGDAANMTLDPRPGGCWCEKMGEKGGVQHMTVTFAAPGAALVLRGPLGPFYDAPVEGVLKWSLKKTSTGTDVSMSFRASGSFKNGFEAISPAVDKVLTDQSDRLKKYLETKNSVP